MFPGSVAGWIVRRCGSTVLQIVEQWIETRFGYIRIVPQIPTAIESRARVAALRSSMV